MPSNAQAKVAALIGSQALQIINLSAQLEEAFARIRELELKGAAAKPRKSRAS